jgi:hypothetical protein
MNQLAVQQALYAKLIANAPLALLLAEDPDGGSPSRPAVYDKPPQPEFPENEDAFPFVTIGDTTAAEFDTDDLDGQEMTVTIHVWSRYNGSKQVKEVSDAIHAALHRQSLGVQGAHEVYCYWEFAESIPEPDPLVQHGVTRFRILTMEEGA